MAVQRPSYGSFAEMPEGLRGFLLSPEFNSVEQTLQDTYKFDEAAQVLIGDQMMDAVFGDLKLAEVVAKIKAALVPQPLDEVKWKAFLADFLKLEAWPLRDLFGTELSDLLAENQIPTSGWPNFKVHLKPMTYSGASTEIAALAGFSLLGPQMRERLRDLLMSKQKGVRIDAQVLEVMCRPADFGGLGLDAAMAKKALDAMSHLIASVKIMSEDEYADWLSEEAKKKTAQESEAAAAPSEEEAEIARIKASMPAEPAAPQTALDEAVEKTYAALPVKPESEYSGSRLKHIISSRLRDVRNSIELVQLLARDTKVGGLGLEQTAAAQMAEAIEASYHQFHDKILAEEKTKIETQLGLQKEKIEDRKRKEAEEHARWYQEKILSRKQDEEAQKKLTAEMRRTWVGASDAAHPMDLKEQRKETERFGPMVGAVSAGAAPLSAVTEPKTQNLEPSTQNLTPKPPSAPTSAQAARPEVKISTQTILEPHGPKPRMDDVKYGGPQLTGLVEELKRFNLAEFRRLAKDPEAAAIKILQKLETLAQESFEKKMAGTKAFLNSPLQQTYLSLVTESFRAGKSVMEIAESKRKSGEDTLAPAEISAVISLNSKLHF
jgi:hypothetical protein